MKTFIILLVKILITGTVLNMFYKRRTVKIRLHRMSHEQVQRLYEYLSWIAQDPGVPAGAAHPENVWTVALKDDLQPSLDIMNDYLDRSRPTYNHLDELRSELKVALEMF